MLEPKRRDKWRFWYTISNPPPRQRHTFALTIYISDWRAFTIGYRRKKWIP